ncbi:MAG TPA: hypothetical protein VMU16_04295 [Candidatus Binataceae bacterium]|nr:hypothetical protein [Candidatus Binataceae bacterium]
MIDWTIEWPKIVAQAVAHGVDPRFIRAIREQENGDPGREFGVLSVQASTYDEQLQVCCVSVAHRAGVFDANDPPLFERLPIEGLYYSDAFIQYFGKIWAPMKAANDPGNLNANWIAGVRAIYTGLVRMGVTE